MKYVDCCSKTGSQIKVMQTDAEFSALFRPLKIVQTTAYFNYPAVAKRYFSVVQR